MELQFQSYKGLSLKKHTVKKDNNYKEIIFSFSTIECYPFSGHQDASVVDTALITQSIHISIQSQERQTNDLLKMLLIR